MKIAIFEDGPLIPTTEGASNRIFNFATNLHENKLDISVIKCRRECDNIALFRSAAKKYGIDFYMISPKKFYGRHSIIPELIRNIGIDIIQTKDPETLLTSCLSAKEKYSTKINYDAHYVQHIILNQLGADKKTIGLMKFKDYAASHYADVHTCVSKDDMKKFIEMGCSRSKLKIIPNGVDTFLVKPYGENCKSKTVLFIGNMHYPPNMTSVEYICKYVIPTTKKIDSKIKFVFVGACPEKIKRKYSAKNTIFTGIVNEIEPYLKNASVCLSPTFEGSGTRIKILNYAAAAKPIISTTLGAEGLNFKNQKDIIIENDIKKYSKIIISLITDPDSCGAMGNSARKTSLAYDWRKITQKLAGVYRKL